MHWDAFGRYQAMLDGAGPLAPAEEELAARVCPFSSRSLDEDQIAGQLYGDTASRHPAIGYFTHTYTGHVTEGTFREEGSSGGMGSWIAAELLRLDHVDVVVHVRPRPASAQTSEPLFEFTLAATPDELRQGAHSHYYPVTLAAVLARIRANPHRRYALIGVPCFIKAARLLALQDGGIATAIRYYIGLVCGHLKSKAFAHWLGWQAGITPQDLQSVDFRHKLEGRSPRHYGFRAAGRGADGHGPVVVGAPMSEVFGADWGFGLFKYKACDFCDDVLAETADVVIGDAWLPRFDADWRGTNILIVRHALFATLLATAAQQSRVAISPVTADEVAASQRAGLSHRRQGLGWRLAAAERRGEWHPPKRVPAGSAGMSAGRQRIYALREQLRDVSHEAFAIALERNEPGYFTGRLQPLIKNYYDQFKPSLLLRVRNRLRKLWRRFSPRLSDG
jgi:coenzyme F420 hydrogenase subunit beta